MNGVLGLSYEQFTNLSLTLGVGGLMAFMVYTMFRLARESGAGRFGTLIIFISLGLGLVGFMVKSIIQLSIDV